MFIGARAGHADNFQKVYYDPATDVLVIVVLYRGTNPYHQFTLKWGPCIDRGGNRREIVAELLTNNTKMPRGRTTGKRCG